MKILVLLLVLALVKVAQAGDAPSMFDIPLKDIHGKDTSLKAYQGKVLLVVNVASECGFTRQYAPLEKIHREHAEEGLVVLGFPSNDFGGQEPGTNEQIEQFCQSKFDVTFPLFDKIRVKGEEKHPLYAALTGTKSPFPGEVKWNFGKFLISRDGRIVQRFESRDEPDSEKVLGAIRRELAAK
jgi:glutathione peroxidase